MRFQFYKEESKIIDLLFFPSTIYTEENMNDIHNERNDLDDIMEEGYLELLKTCESTLKPYKEEIEVFYSKSPMDYYDFSSLIMESYTVFGFKKEEDYLEHLLSLKEEEIKVSLIKAIMKLEEKETSAKDNGESEKDKDSISLDTNVMELIKNLSIDSACKWDLYMMMEEPKKYITQYVELLYKLLPEYRRFYLQYEEKVTECGIKLEEYLNNEEDGLDKITCYMVSTKMLAKGKTAILISFIQSYTLRLIVGTSVPYLLWGLRMEYSFQALKEKRENKLSERILVFKNLGDKTRYEVLRLIAGGESSTKNIAAALSVSSATISYHINALVTANIIQYEKNNSKVGYEVDWNLIREVFDGLKKDLLGEEEESLL